LQRLLTVVLGIGLNNCFKLVLKHFTLMDAVARYDPLGSVPKLALICPKKVSALLFLPMVKLNFFSICNVGCLLPGTQWQIHISSQVTVHQKSQLHDDNSSVGLGRLSKGLHLLGRVVWSGRVTCMKVKGNTGIWWKETTKKT
jgi:hypothetical protein